MGLPIRIEFLVRKERLELSRLAALEPKSSASTNSATFAKRALLYIANNFNRITSMPINHYENFPVASYWLPRKLRQPIETIYWFARSADDIADEGDVDPADRLAALATYELQIKLIEQQQPISDPQFDRLAKVIHQYHLPTALFLQLLDAFKQDVTTTRYADEQQLLLYCQRSANPIGRLLLYLFEAVNEKNLLDSDRICTALQLINFWQDIAVDWRKGRIYIPQKTMISFGITEQHIAAGITDEPWCRLLSDLCGRVHDLMHAGSGLVLRLPGRVGWELRLVIQGGLRIIEKIVAVNYDVFRYRPTIRKHDALLLLPRALLMR